jgi:predicted ATPase
MAVARELFLKRVAIELPAAAGSGYPFGLPAVRHFGARTLRSPVTVLVGENGSGKSTLLEAIAVAIGMNAEGGGRNFRFATRATHSPLHESVRLARAARVPDTWFLRAESFYNVATEIEGLDGHPDHATCTAPPIVGSYGGLSLHEQSHGESFWSLFTRRFGIGLYLLDEPEAALSPQRQMAFLVRLHELVQRGAQFVYATHAPMLMAYPGAEVWECTASGVRTVAPAETNHWQLLRRFLVDPDPMLRELLA